MFLGILAAVALAVGSINSVERLEAEQRVQVQPMQSVQVGQVWAEE